MIINPSFTGTTFGNRIYSDILSSRSPYTKTYTKILSTDFFIRSKNLGVGIYGGTRNNGMDETFTLWGEGSFSKLKRIKGRKFLIPSVSIGMDQTITDMGLKFHSKLFSSSNLSNITPEEAKLKQGIRLHIKSGIIIANHEWNAGFCGMINGKIILPKEEDEEEDSGTTTTSASTRNDSEENKEDRDLKFRMVAHWMKTISYNHRGLLSQKYYLQPRFFLDYSTDRTQIYSDIKIQHFRWNAGFGLMHNLSNKKSRAVLMGGYDLKRFKLNYLISGGFTENNKFAIVQGLNIKIIIPELAGERNLPVSPLIRDI